MAQEGRQALPFSYSSCFCRLTALRGTQADSGLMTKSKSSTSPANTPDQPAAGKGMPAKNPQLQRSLPGQQETPKDASAAQALELPHDRDQAADMTSGQPSPRIGQAAKDIDEGRKDTSKAPEMDHAYKKQV